MSVLYKALQKAAKDNEQRQPAQSGFDAERLAGSGVIRGAGGNRLKWRIAGVAVTIVFVAAMGAALYLTSSSPSAPPQMQTVSLAPPAQSMPQKAAPQTAPQAPAPAPQVVAAQAPVAAAGIVQGSSAPVPSVPPPSVPPPSVPGPPAAQQIADAAPATTVAEGSGTSTVPSIVNAPAPPRPVTVPKAAARDPMPQIAANSPARMLSPPISVRRADADLGGVGNVVQVRQVSQEAQDSVGAGYAALIRGEYDTALGFYDEALKREPTSVLASLGRAAALQKLGRSEDARIAYNNVLKIDPANREALTNLTGILADRQPGEALKQLLDLQKEYSNFSPIVAQIGMTYAKMDNLDAAVDFLRRAVAMTPDAVMYHYNLAIVLDRMKLGEQAAASYREVLDLMDGRKVPELSKVDIERRVAFLTVK